MMVMPLHEEVSFVLRRRFIEGSRVPVPSRCLHAHVLARACACHAARVCYRGPSAAVSTTSKLTFRIYEYEEVWGVFDLEQKYAKKRGKEGDGACCIVYRYLVYFLLVFFIYFLLCPEKLRCLLDEYDTGVHGLFCLLSASWIQTLSAYFSHYY